MKWENWKAVLEQCGFKTYYGNRPIRMYGPWSVDVEPVPFGGGYSARLILGYMPGMCARAVIESACGDTEDAAFSALLNTPMCTGHVMVYQLIGADNHSVEYAESRRVVSALIQARREGVS